MIYIGIDPGVTGAIAEIQPGTAATLDRVAVRDLPVLKTAGRSRIDVIDLRNMLTGYARGGVQVIAAVEEVRAVPKWGAPSAFRFGEAFGQIIAVLTALDIPLDLIPPKVWQRGVFKGKAKDPDTARLEAARKWPWLREALKRKCDHNRADALWIAEYLRRREVGNHP